MLDPTLNVAELVDNIGYLKADIAERETREKALRDFIVALGAGAYDGEVFRATVSVADRTTIDWKGIAETLKPSLRLPRDKWSDQIVEMVDNHTAAKPVTTLRVVARNGR